MARQRFQKSQIVQPEGAEREKGGKRGRAECFEANSMSGGLAQTREAFRSITKALKNGMSQDADQNEKAEQG